MSEKITARAGPEKTPQRAGATRGDPGRASYPPHPLSGLQQSIGNQAMLQLLESGVIQAKLRVSQPGDAAEVEADRVADQVVSRQHAPVLQRKCSCEGGTSCSKCAGEDEEKIHRSAAAPNLRLPEFLVQRSPADTSPAPTQSAPGTQAQTPAERSQPPAQIIVDDEAKTVAPHQMRKSQFLALLRADACATADAVLMSVGHTTKSCPYIEKWLGFYEKQSSHHIEQALRKYAPETAAARNAHEAIRMAVKRVQRAALTWAKTGKVEGVPKELAGQIPGEGGFLAGMQSAASSGVGGGILGLFGGQKKKEDSGPGNVMRKARNGEQAPAHDAASVRSQLGSGHSLDSRVQSQMSSAFGHDFSGVRIHTDTRAASLSSDLQARAFTIGSDVAFASGEYKPGTLIGDALIAHELAHVVQQGGATSPPPVSRSVDTAALEADADNSAIGAVSSLIGKAARILGRTVATAIPQARSGLRLQRCNKSEHEKEIERLGTLQYGFMEDKRKAEEAKLKKEADEEAKKKGQPPPASAPKVEMGDVIKTEEGKYALKSSPTTEWDTADQPAWRKRAADAWTAVVASVKGTELESIASGVTFDFDPKRALEEGFYAKQSEHHLIVGMSWVKFAEKNPKNAWENLAHEMAGHLQYGRTYATDIMDSALSKLSPADRSRFKGDERKFFETYEYGETEIYASLWQRRYRVPEVGPAPESGGIDPDSNITNKLTGMHDVLQPEVARAVLNELKRRVFANDQILARDKKFFLDKVKEIFGYSL